MGGGDGVWGRERAQKNKARGVSERNSRVCARDIKALDCDICRASFGGKRRKKGRGSVGSRGQMDQREVC